MNMTNSLGSHTILASVSLQKKNTGIEMIAKSLGVDKSKIASVRSKSINN